MTAVQAQAVNQEATSFAQDWLQRTQPAVTHDQAGQALLSQLGIDAQVVGAPTLEQRGNMGVVGQRYSTTQTDNKPSAPQYVGANADTMTQVAHEAVAHHPAYPSVMSSAAPQQGYNPTTAYLKAWQQHGQDMGLGQCMSGMPDSLATGQYGACSGKQRDQLYQRCDTAPRCVQYQLQEQTQRKQQPCRLTATATMLRCHQVPTVQIARERIRLPTCQTLRILQGAAARCPGGYQTVAASDMIHGVNWDDVTLCVQAASADASQCYSGGFYVLSQTRSPLHHDSAVVPMGLHARLQLSNAYRESVALTLVNQTTHTRLIDHQAVADGAVIELPYSTAIAQTFQFMLTRLPYRRHGTGVAVLLIDREGEQQHVTVVQHQQCTEEA